MQDEAKVPQYCPDSEYSSKVIRTSTVGTDDFYLVKPRPAIKDLLILLIVHKFELLKPCKIIKKVQQRFAKI